MYIRHVTVPVGRTTRVTESQVSSFNQHVECCAEFQKSNFSMCRFAVDDQATRSESRQCTAAHKTDASAIHDEEVSKTVLPVQHHFWL